MKSTLLSGITIFSIFVLFLSVGAVIAHDSSEDLIGTTSIENSHTVQETQAENQVSNILTEFNPTPHESSPGGIQVLENNQFANMNTTNSSNHTIPGFELFAHNPDLNSDGTINIDDVLILINNWNTCVPQSDCMYDIDGNGAVDSNDLHILLSLWGMDMPLVSTSPDFDQDGDVDVDDLMYLINHWGACVQHTAQSTGTQITTLSSGLPFCLADLDYDNTVGDIDLALLLAAWSPPTIPGNNTNTTVPPSGNGGPDSDSGSSGSDGACYKYSYVCTEWSQCTEGQQARTCTFQRYQCASAPTPLVTIKPTLTQTCAIQNLGTTDQEQQPTGISQVFSQLTGAVIGLNQKSRGFFGAILFIAALAIAVVIVAFVRSKKN